MYIIGNLLFIFFISERKYHLTDKMQITNEIILLDYPIKLFEARKLLFTKIHNDLVNGDNNEW